MSISFSIDQIVALSNRVLAEIVQVDSYEYTPCYLWHDSPLYNAFGDEILHLKGNTIYLYRESDAPIRDLFHELGHVVNRLCHLVGNTENGYQAEWEQKNIKLIAEISEQRHWSSYLNLFSLTQKDFESNAASEVWAELFMLWHLYPDSAEARLLDEPMAALKRQSVCLAASRLALELGLPGRDADIKIGAGLQISKK